MEELDFFKCKECGCKSLIVKEYGAFVPTYIESQVCKCGESDNIDG